MEEQQESYLNLMQLQWVQEIDIDQVVASFIIKSTWGYCLLDLFCLFEEYLALYFSACIYNDGHNTLKIFDNISVIISNKDGICELPHELPNDLNVRILGNEKRSGKSQNIIK